MAAIGTAWVDGAWIEAGWVSGAWSSAVPGDYPADYIVTARPESYTAVSAVETYSKGAEDESYTS